MDKSVISSKTSRHKGPLLKIALVGDSEVGKSTIISTFIVKKRQIILIKFCKKIRMKGYRRKNSKNLSGLIVF